MERETGAAVHEVEVAGIRPGGTDPEIEWDEAGVGAVGPEGDCGCQLRFLSLWRDYWLEGGGGNILLAASPPPSRHRTINSGIMFVLLIQLALMMSFWL